MSLLFQPEKQRRHRKSTVFPNGSPRQTMANGGTEILTAGLQIPTEDFILTTLTAIGSTITAGALRAAAPDLTATVRDSQSI